MKIGKLENTNLINDTWKVCYDSGELAAATTSISISGLNGDVDIEYRLILRCVAGADGTVIRLRPNNDTNAANYHWQGLFGTPDAASADQGDGGMFLVYDATTSNTGKISLSDVTLYAKSGYLRTSFVKCTLGISGTAINGCEEIGNVWTNTADNITSLVITHKTTNGLGIGTRAILLKKVTATSGLKTGALQLQSSIYGTWQKVYETTLTSAASSVTISGLDGNTDVLYRLTVRGRNSEIDAEISFALRLNNDSGSNYGFQALWGNNTTIGHGNSAPRASLSLGDPTLNRSTYSTLLLYAKSDYARAFLQLVFNSTSGTTAGGITRFGSVWNNTADNVTSLVIYEYSSTANALGIGTYILLEKLVLS